MWKPGSKKPSSGGNLHLSNSNKDHTTTGTSSKTSKKKKLSGATMNMRFMKRRKENEGSSAQQDTAETTAAPPATQPAHLQTNDLMDVDQEVSFTPLASLSANNTTFVDDSVATPIDMYGVQAALTGRRSFGGFHPAMEEIWKNAKDSYLEQENPSKKKKTKISDEELLERYQEIVQKRSEKRKVVGNLDRKVKGKNKKR